jgi:hypothetical protein
MAPSTESLHATGNASTIGQDKRLVKNRECSQEDTVWEESIQPIANPTGTGGGACATIADEDPVISIDKPH